MVKVGQTLIFCLLAKGERPRSVPIPSTAEGIWSLPASKVRVSLKLVGTIGIPAGHAATPLKTEVTLDSLTHRVLSEMSGSVTSVNETVQGESDGETPDFTNWPFFDVFGQSSTVYVENLPETIAESLFRRGWGDVPREAVVIPISAEGDGMYPFVRSTKHKCSHPIEYH